MLSKHLEEVSWEVIQMSWGGLLEAEGPANGTGPATGPSLTCLRNQEVRAAGVSGGGGVLLAVVDLSFSSE